MKNIIILFISSLFLISCSIKKDNAVFVNPTESLKVEFNLTANKTPFYKVFYENNVVIDSSHLGIIMEQANFYNDLSIIKISEPISVEDSYSMFHGKQKKIDYKANQYTVHLKNKQGELMDIIFNLSDDGLAFRYYFPETSTDLKKIMEEKTTYNFTENAKAWLQPMSKAKTGWKETNPSYEEHYAMGIPVNTKPEIGEGWVYPALFNTNDTWVLITETGLHANYSGTRLVYNESLGGMQVTFPQKEEVLDKGALNPESEFPWFTPWRILTIGSLKTITESTLGTDLADKAIAMDTFIH